MHSQLEIKRCNNDATLDSIIIFLMPDPRYARHVSIETNYELF